MSIAESKISEVLDDIVNKVAERQNAIAAEDLESLQQLGVITDILIKIGKYLRDQEKKSIFEEVDELEADIR